MAQHKRYVPVLSDKAIIVTLKKAYKYLLELNKLSINQLNVNFSTIISSQPIEVKSLEAFDSVELNAIAKAGNTLITNASLRFDNYSFSYVRTPPPSDSNATNMGVISINLQNQVKIDFTELNELSSILSKGFLLSYKTNTDNVVEEHSRILSDIEALTIKVQEDTSDFRNKLEQEFIEKFKNVEKEKKETINNVETEYKRKIEALEQREKELDDRANTHARREIRKEINKKIKERIDNFKSSSEVKSLRWPINLAYISLIIISGCGLFYFSNEFSNQLNMKTLSQNQIALVLALLKPLTFAGIFSSSFVFYIKWLNSWFEKNSNEEFFLRKYQLDVERSSWIVETVLESVGQHKQELPNELILSFSNNLFKNEETIDKRLEHPVDQLASAILGSASKAKVKVGDSILELDRKSIKNLESQNT